MPVQINTKDPASKPILECYHQFWTPDLRILDVQGAELYRWNGYLPPYEFLPQLLAGRAHAFLRLQNNTEALALLENLLDRFPTSAAAPEALYFLAVAKYKTGGQGSDLANNWRRLQTLFPRSIWRVKQSFMENHS